MTPQIDPRAKFTDTAVMVSEKSRTQLAVRCTAFGEHLALATPVNKLGPTILHPINRTVLGNISASAHDPGSIWRRPRTLEAGRRHQLLHPDDRLQQGKPGCCSLI